MGAVKEFFGECASDGIFPLSGAAPEGFQILEQETLGHDGKPFTFKAIDIEDAVAWHNGTADDAQKQEIRQFFECFGGFMDDDVSCCDQCGKLGFSVWFWNLISGKTCAECFESGNY